MERAARTLVDLGLVSYSVVPAFPFPFGVTQVREDVRERIAEAVKHTRRTEADVVNSTVDVLLAMQREGELKLPPDPLLFAMVAAALSRS